MMQATPTTWRSLIQAGWTNASGMHVLCGGESMSTPLKAAFRNLRCEVWNLYGPTETTIWSTIQRLRDGDERNVIGKPIANTEIYVVDAELRPVPIMVLGEICIGGAGLANGYLNQPSNTAERFVESPFKPGQRIYRTGDLGRWRHDGTLEYIERMDAQVKVN